MGTTAEKRARIAYHNEFVRLILADLEKHFLAEYEARIKEGNRVMAMRTKIKPVKAAKAPATSKQVQKARAEERREKRK